MNDSQLKGNLYPDTDKYMHVHYCNLQPCSATCDHWFTLLSMNTWMFLFTILCLDKDHNKFETLKMEKIISPQTFFLMLKLIDKYNTIYNINNIKQRMTLQN